MRDEGFYWVRADDLLTIAEWTPRAQRWLLPGEDWGLVDWQVQVVAGPLPPPAIDPAVPARVEVGHKDGFVVLNHFGCEGVPPNFSQFTPAEARKLSEHLRRCADEVDAGAAHG